MAHKPRQIGDVLSELMARRGYARLESVEAFEACWREAAGPLAARYTRVGLLRRGVLEVVVAHSTLMQELTFQKPQLLRALGESLPDQSIQDIRFRVGAVE